MGGEGSVLAAAAALVAHNIKEELQRLGYANGGWADSIRNEQPAPDHVTGYARIPGTAGAALADPALVNITAGRLMQRLPGIAYRDAVAMAHATVQALQQPAMGDMGTYGNGLVQQVVGVALQRADDFVLNGLDDVIDDATGAHNGATFVI